MYGQRHDDIVRYDIDLVGKIKYDKLSIMLNSAKQKYPIGTESSSKFMLT